MGITKVGISKATGAGAKVVSNLPTHPADYYGSARNDVDSVEWVGGEVCYLSDNRFYVQTATSGVTATWKRKLEATISA